MKIKGIKKDYYRLEKIAAYWEMDVDDLLDYADMGCLKIHILVSPVGAFPLSRYAARQALESPIQFLLSHNHINPLNGLITLVITHKEKEKFEEIYGRGKIDPKDGQPKNQMDETDVEMVRRLTPNGVDIKDSKDLELKMNIASELKAAFPQTTPHRVGVLLTQNPDNEVSVDAFRKRGRKLLGLIPGKKKEVN